MPHARQLVGIVSMWTRRFLSPQLEAAVEGRTVQAKDTHSSGISSLTSLTQGSNRNEYLHSWELYDNQQMVCVIVEKRENIEKKKEQKSPELLPPRSKTCSCFDVWPSRLFMTPICTFMFFTKICILT